MALDTGNACEGGGDDEGQKSTMERSDYEAISTML